MVKFVEDLVLRQRRVVQIPVTLIKQAGPLSEKWFD